MRAEVFETIKSALRARNLTYSDLADRLGISEPTVKRIFANRDTKLSRIVEICDALDLTLEDVVAQSGRIDPQPVRLGAHVERQLAEDLPAFRLFILLNEGLKVDDIMRQYHLDRPAVFRLGMRLERMGLVDVLSNEHLRLRVQGPIRLDRDGPLHLALARLNVSFVQQVFLARDTELGGFFTQSCHVSEATARQMVQHIQELSQAFKEMARQDRLTLPAAELTSRKLAIAFSDVDYARLMDLDDEKWLSSR